MRLAGRGAGGLDDVGVDGALREPADPVELRRLLLEDLDERAPDAPALLLRIRHSGERGEEPILGVDPSHVDPEVSGERGHDLVAFVEPQQAVVDEDAGQAIADGAVQQRRHHGGVDTARQREQDPVAAEPAAHPRDAVVDDRARRPARPATADVVHEPAQDARALPGMGHLGMELHAVEAAPFVGDAGDGRAVGGCDAREPGRQRAHAVAVAHPHVEQAVAFGVHLVLDAGEQPRMPARADLRVAELALVRGLDLSTELCRHRLHAVADSEDGNAELEYRIRGAVAGGLVHRLGASGKDDSPRLHGAEPFRGDVEGVDLGVHVRLAYAPGDELGVLGAEIENDDPVGVDVGGEGQGTLLSRQDHCAVKAVHGQGTCPQCRAGNFGACPR